MAINIKLTLNKYVKCQVKIRQLIMVLLDQFYQMKMAKSVKSL